MSVTAYGTVVLHASPEAAVGGTLALVRSCDMITLDVARRVVHLEVDEATLAARRSQWVPPPLPKRGWVRLYMNTCSRPIKERTSIFLSATAALTLQAIPIEEESFQPPGNPKWAGVPWCSFVSLVANRIQETRRASRRSHLPATLIPS